METSSHATSLNCASRCSLPTYSKFFVRRAEEDHQCRARAATDSQMSHIVRRKTAAEGGSCGRHMSDKTPQNCTYPPSLPRSVCRRHRTLTLADSCRTIKHQPPPPPPAPRRQKSSHAANAEWNLCTNADRQTTDTVCGGAAWGQFHFHARLSSPNHIHGIHSHHKVCPKVINKSTLGFRGWELVNSKSRTIAQMRMD